MKLLILLLRFTGVDVHASVATSCWSWTELQGCNVEWARVVDAVIPIPP